VAVGERSPSRSRLEPEFRASYGENLVAALLGTWMTLGGFVDGFAHRNLDTPETFFTPWHGILYSGYLTAVVWMIWLVARNRDRATSLRSAVPEGYTTSALGLIVFAAGGVGDLLWHTLFGIEVSIEALLSPTHLLLLIGAIMFVTGPLRAGWGDGSYRPGRIRHFWPVLLSLSMAAAQLGFFFQYVDGLSTRLMQVPYSPGSEEGFFAVVAGIASILITTAILMGALLLLIRRWTAPFGSGLVVFGLFALLMESLEGFDFPEDLIAPVIAGLIADLLVRVLGPGPTRLWAVRWFAFLVPVLMWGVRFAVFERFADIAWPIEIWSGVVAFSGLTGVGLSLLAFPPDEVPAPEPQPLQAKTSQPPPS